MQGIELRSDIPVKESEWDLTFKKLREATIEVGSSSWDLFYCMTWLRIQLYWHKKGL